MDAFEIGTDGPQVIVVGVDGSRTSIRAAAYAAGLARRQSARLVAVHVRSAPALTALAPVATMGETLEEISEEVRQQVVAGAAAVGVPVEFVAADGDPHLALTRAAEEARADAVVVGASEHSGHRLVGSLAVRLVRSGRWPVTVVP